MAFIISFIKRQALSLANWQIIGQRKEKLQLFPRDATEPSSPTNWAANISNGGIAHLWQWISFDEPESSNKIKWCL